MSLSFELLGMDGAARRGRCLTDSRERRDGHSRKQLKEFSLIEISTLSNTNNTLNLHNIQFNTSPQPSFNKQFDLLIESCINQLNKNRFFILESSLQTYSIPPGRVKEYGDTQLSFWKKEQ